MGCEWPGRGAFQQLYGTRRAAATHVTVGMSLDCRKLGLGVAHAGTRRAASATPAHSVILSYTCLCL